MKAQIDLEKLSTAQYLHPLTLTCFGWTLEKIAAEFDVSYSTIVTYAASANPYSKAKRKVKPPLSRCRTTARIVKDLLKEAQPKGPIPQEYLI